MDTKFDSAKRYPHKLWMRVWTLRYDAFGLGSIQKVLKDEGYDVPSKTAIRRYLDRMAVKLPPGRRRMHFQGHNTKREQFERTTYPRYLQDTIGIKPDVYGHPGISSLHTKVDCALDLIRTDEELAKAFIEAFNQAIANQQNKCRLMRRKMVKKCLHDYDPQQWEDLNELDLLQHQLAKLHGKPDAEFEKVRMEFINQAKRFDYQAGHETEKRKLEDDFITYCLTYHGDEYTKLKATYERKQIEFEQKWGESYWEKGGRDRVQKIKDSLQSPAKDTPSGNVPSTSSQGSDSGSKDAPSGNVSETSGTEPNSAQDGNQGGTK